MLLVCGVWMLIGWFIRFGDVKGKVVFVYGGVIGWYGCCLFFFEWNCYDYFDFV